MRDMPTAINQEANTGQRTAIRWRVCAAVSFHHAGLSDAQTLSVLKTTLEMPHNLNFTEADYGWVVFSFQVAYGVFFMFAGRLVDYVGAKIGLAVGVVVWSIAAAAGGVVNSWQAWP